MKIKKIEKDRNRKNIIKMLMLTMIFFFGMFLKTKAEDDGLPKLQGDEKILLSNEYKPAELRLEVTKLKSKELKGYVDEENKKIFIDIPEDIQISDNVEIYLSQEPQRVSKPQSISSVKKSRKRSLIQENSEKKYYEIDYEEKPENLYLIYSDNKNESLERIYKILLLEMNLKESCTTDTIGIYIKKNFEGAYNINIDLNKGTIFSDSQNSVKKIEGCIATVSGDPSRYPSYKFHPKDSYAKDLFGNRIDGGIDLASSETTIYSTMILGNPGAHNSITPQIFTNRVIIIGTHGGTMRAGILVVRVLDFDSNPVGWINLYIDTDDPTKVPITLTQRQELQFLNLIPGENNKEQTQVGVIDISPIPNMSFTASIPENYETPLNSEGKLKIHTLNARAELNSEKNDNSWIINITGLADTSESAISGEVYTGTISVQVNAIPKIKGGQF